MPQAEAGSGAADVEAALALDVSDGPGRRVPLSELPPLPPRERGYRTEPLVGICTVAIFSIMLVAITEGVASASDASDFVKTLGVLIWVEAAIAALSTAILLLYGAGVVHRSEETCYPMPRAVEELLIDGRPLPGFGNIKGPPGHPRLGTYCVRCYVWRPPDRGPVHHCSTCSRCVVGFDHHCGVFGRCIVSGNMPCFMAIIAMMFAGMATALGAVMCAPSRET